jgi:Leucine Rich repeat
MPFPIQKFLLCEHVFSCFLNDWIDPRSMSTLDMAITNRDPNQNTRLLWLRVLGLANFSGDWNHSHLSIKWLIMRGLRTTSIEIGKRDGNEITDSTFESINICCPLSISLDECHNIGDQCLKRIAIGCPCLKKISLSGPNITDAGVSSIGYGCSRLQTIDTTFDDDISEVSAVVSGQCCRFLQSITLTNCSRITGTGLSAIALGCSLLERIKFVGCDNIAGASLALFGQRCPLLRTVEFGGNVTDAELSNLAHGCPLLQTIHLTGCHGISGDSLSVLVHGCPSLSHIHINRCEGISDAPMIMLGQRCPRLQYLYFRGFENVTDVGLSALGSGCPRLELIDLDCVTASDVGLLALAEWCPLLQTVKLCKCVNVSDSGLSLAMHRLLHLRGIYVGRCENITWQNKEELRREFYPVRVEVNDGIIDVFNDRS